MLKRMGIKRTRKLVSFNMLTEMATVKGRFHGQMKLDKETEHACRPVSTHKNVNLFDISFLPFL